MRYLAALHAHEPSSAGDVDPTYWSDATVALSRWAVHLVCCTRGSEPVLDGLTLRDPVPSGPLRAEPVDDLAAALHAGGPEAVHMGLVHDGVATNAFDHHLRGTALAVPNLVARDDFLLDLHARAPPAPSTPLPRTWSICSATAPPTLLRAAVQTAPLFSEVLDDRAVNGGKLKAVWPRRHRARPAARPRACFASRSAWAEGQTAQGLPHLRSPACAYRAGQAHDRRARPPWRGRLAELVGAPGPDLGGLGGGDEPRGPASGAARCGRGAGRGGGAGGHVRGRWETGRAPRRIAAVLVG